MASKGSAWYRAQQAAKETKPGYFNIYEEMHYLSDDLTPNNINTGEKQIRRRRTDQVELRKKSPSKKT